MSDLCINTSDVVHWCGWPCLVHYRDEQIVIIMNHAGATQTFAVDDIIQLKDNSLHIHPDKII